MKRRDFITLIGGAAVAASGAARAQAERIRHVGILMGYAEDEPDTRARVAAFREALEQLGWKDGRNVQFTYRFGGGDLDRVRGYAKELAGLNPDLIVCETTPTLKAVADQTTTIPVVFVSVTDPVSNGFVADLARPGGNITGFTNFEATMGGKWLELVSEIAPSVKRVAMLFNPQTASADTGGGVHLQSIEAGARVLGIELIVSPVHAPADIDGAFAAIARSP